MKIKSLNGILRDIVFSDFESYKIRRGYSHLNIVIADLYVVAYDCTDRSTLKGIPAIIKRISNVTNFKGKTILISTKCDADQKSKYVTEEEARSLQRQLGFLHYFQTSAKDGTGIEELKAAIVEFAANQ